MTIDLRSDTLTKPSKAMLEAMLKAEVGDDVMGEDPTVKALEEKIALMFGMEEALFCASGTMANQIAINVHVNPREEVICHKYSHVYLYEGGGIASNSMASVKLLEGNLGRINAKNVEKAINNKEDIHNALSKLVVVENTMNKGGGSIYELDELKDIKKVCDANQLKFHLDGARLFNALVETNEDPKEYGQLFDSISICLSKGLGCPVGSLLIGTKADITKARKVRKTWGGGWRQAGFLAAAGIYALENNIERLKEDHAHAKAIETCLKKQPYIKEVYQVFTNIIIFEPKINAKEVNEALAKENILVVPFGENLLRMVTHMDISHEHIQLLETKLNYLSF